MKKVIGLVLILIIITASIFFYSIQIRKPWFGALAIEHHSWLTATTIKFTKNWFYEGPLKLKFGLIENPNSIEFKDLSARKPYGSYPPGTIIPIYLISKLEGAEPSPAMVMAYNLSNHFLIAIILALTIFFFTRQLKLSLLNSFIFALIPISLELLLPFPLYYHQNVFFSDQAVILPVALLIFLEVIRDGLKNKKWPIDIIISVIIFYGALIDWFFFIVVFFIYLKRLLNGQLGKNFSSFLKKTVFYVAPILLVLMLFTLQILVLKMKDDLFSKFLERTGSVANVKISFTYFTQIFWNQWVVAGFGRTGKYLIWLCLAVFVCFLLFSIVQLFRRKKINYKLKKSLSLFGIILVPIFAQIYFLKQHSVVHDFSALKLSLFMAVLPFVVVPILIIISIFLILKKKFKISKNIKNLIFLISSMLLLVISLIYVQHEFHTYKNLFPEPYPPYKIIGEFVANNTKYEEIVFSPDFAIQANPPQFLATSMKRIYLIHAIGDINQTVGDIQSDFTIDIFFINQDLAMNNDNIDNHFKQIISKAFEVKNMGEMYLYKIKKEDYLLYLQGQSLKSN